jgi:hypothetical protein
MHGNRDSIMKPDAAVWRYRRLAGGAGLIPDGAKFMVLSQRPSVRASYFLHKTALHAGFISTT